MRTAFGAWLSPVERTVRVREVPSSNLGAPTKSGPPPIRVAVCFAPQFIGDRLSEFVRFRAPTCLGSLALLAGWPRQGQGRLSCRHFESILAHIFTTKEIQACTTPVT